MFELTSPCNNCPFRKDVPPFLRRSRAAEISQTLLDDGQFPCHKTVEHDDETGEHVPDLKHEKQCAGAMIILEKLQRPNQFMRVGQRLGIYDPDKLNMEAPVFDNFDEWIAAQAINGRPKNWKPPENK